MSRDFLEEELRKFLDNIAISCSGVVRCGERIKGSGDADVSCGHPLELGPSAILTHLLQHLRDDISDPRVTILHSASVVPKDCMWLFHDQVQSELDMKIQTHEQCLLFANGMKKLSADVQDIKRQYKSSMAESFAEFDIRLQKLEQALNTECIFVEQEHTKEFQALTHEWPKIRTETVLSSGFRGPKISGLSVPNEFASTKSRSICRKPNEEQWRNLRKLRSDCQILHSKILNVISKRGCTIHMLKQRAVFQRLRVECRSASGFLNAGILTFKDILQKKVPSKLKEVLAFISLSFIMSETLQSKGHATNSATFFQGLPQWRRAISAEREREAFDELIFIIWPEATATSYTACTPSNTSEYGPANSFMPALDGSRGSLEHPRAGFANELFPKLGVAMSETPTLDGSQLFWGTEWPAWEDRQGAPIHHHDSGENLAARSNMLEFFQRPVEDILSYTNSAEEFHWADFLDLSDQALFDDAFLTSTFPLQQNGPKLSTGHNPDKSHTSEYNPSHPDPLTTNREFIPRPKTGSGGEKLEIPILSTPYAAELLVFIRETVIFQIAIIYLQRKVLPAFRPFTCAN